MKASRTCPHCNEEFKSIEGKVFSNHVRWCDKNPQRNARNTCSENLSKGQAAFYDKKFGKKKSYAMTCHRCKKAFTVEEREKQHPRKSKYFCSRACANSRQHSPATRKLMSEKVSEKWRTDEEYRKKCTGNIQGNKYFSSKNERAIQEHFRTKHANDEWTFGGCLKVGEDTYVSRDLYSKKLKICFEYDGVWHFKDIHNQLAAKQEKDALLEQWCI